MKGKKILTLILAVVLAAGMLTACVNVPGSSAGVRLDTSTIEQMLENQGVTATVTADAGLTEAVDTVAASLALYNLKELDSLDVGAMVARQAGVTPAVLRGVRRFLLGQHAAGLCFPAGADRLFPDRKTGRRQLSCGRGDFCGAGRPEADPVRCNSSVKF